MALSQTRKSTQPTANDTWESIARRELSGVDAAEGAQSLQSWNMHVFMRAAPAAGSLREGNHLLPSDVIFLEPPLAS